MDLSKKHLEILSHIAQKVPQGRYCGGSAAMDELVDMGLMKFAGEVAWCPDKFYSITEQGRKELAALSH